MSAVILLLGPVIDTSLLDNCSVWLQKSYSIIDEMVSSGNLIAKFRSSELQQLEETLSHLSTDLYQPSAPAPLQQNEDTTSKTAPSNVITLVGGISNGDNVIDPIILDESNFTEGLTAAQILAVANSIDTGDAEWLSNAITGENIW